jgi:hypothetical protein
MAAPKKIPIETVDNAMKQAQHYRLLNEPALAESICRDIVAVDEKNGLAWITLLLSLTDQFDVKYTHAVDEAKDALAHLTDEFHKVYYEGILYERWARAQLQKEVPLETIESWTRTAMKLYDQANNLAPKDDPNPLLRWNTCARFLEECEKKKPQTNASPPNLRDLHTEFGEDVPYR